MISRRIRNKAGLLLAVAVIAASCSSGDDSSAPATTADSEPVTEPTEAPTESTEPAASTAAEPPAPVTDELLAGASSRSILPTVNGTHDYLAEVQGWSAGAGIDPDDPGLFVAAWDQGRIDVGNGSRDSAWVHDDLAVSAVALQRGDERVVLVTTDTYMQFAVDADAVAEQARAGLPEDWADVDILIAATHNHHGPDTAFSINDDWYQLLADQTSSAVLGAVDSLAPAEIYVAAGTHSYGMGDVRDPVITDPRLNVMTVDALDSGEAIATIVQWGSHPETTLGWHPPADSAGLEAACVEKGWEGDDCDAEGRYLTADYPGVLRDRIMASRGGEVIYFNGAIGNQIGPSGAPTWVVDADHPITDDGTVPDGATPLTVCDDRDEYQCRNFAKTESIGTELANAVTALIDEAEQVEVEQLTVTVEPFLSRLTNIGFRVLIADGDLGWKTATLYNCEGNPSEGNCTEAPNATEPDPVLTPLIDSEITVGDVLPSRIARLDLGDVAFLFMPGELPPEVVIGLPEDFITNTSGYYTEPELHATGADYQIPGYLLSLFDESVTFTVGLGTDELGYWVPVDEYRLKCLDITLADGATCEDLAARGVIEGPDYIGGRICKTITDDPQALQAYGADAPAVASICRYGQALGRELGEPEGHYEETNTAGWDLVDDLWAATQRLAAQ